MLYDHAGRRLRRSIGFLRGWTAVPESHREAGSEADCIGDWTITPDGADDGEPFADDEGDDEADQAVHRVRTVDDGPALRI